MVPFHRKSLSYLQDFYVPLLRQRSNVPHRPRAAADEACAGGFCLEITAPMPTDILLSVEQRRIAERKNSADLRVILLLLPLIACLLSIILSVESAAFEGALVTMGTMD